MSRRDRQYRYRPTGKAGATVKQHGPLKIDLSDNSIGIDSSKLPAPDKLYDADCGWIEQRLGTLSIFFAKRDKGKPGVLHSRLEIRFPPEHFVNTFWGVSARFYQRLSEYVSSWPPEVRPQATTTLGDAPANQSHSEWARFTYMSHSGTEGSIDFYWLSPGDLAKFSKSNDVSGLHVRPIVRVQLTSFELLNILEQAKQNAAVIAATLPARHKNESVVIEDEDGSQLKQERVSGE